MERTSRRPTCSHNRTTEPTNNRELKNSRRVAYLTFTIEPLKLVVNEEQGEIGRQSETNEEAKGIEKATLIP